MFVCPKFADYVLLIIDSATTTKIQNYEFARTAFNLPFQETWKSRLWIFFVVVLIEQFYTPAQHTLATIMWLYESWLCSHYMQQRFGHFNNKKIKTIDEDFCSELVFLFEMNNFLIKKNPLIFLNFLTLYFLDEFNSLN